MLYSFINFSANKAAMNYFLFDKGSEKDWAKEYGGISSVETFGYWEHHLLIQHPSSSSTTSSTSSNYKQESDYTTSSTRLIVQGLQLREVQKNV